MIALGERTAEIWLRTPEGVAFPLRLASPMLRMAAVVIDAMVVFSAWSIIAVLLSLLELFSGDLARGVTIVGFFVFSQGYRILTEWMWRGQSLGKRVMRLRVVDAQGLQLSLPQIVLRNIMRFIDALPFAYAVGGICALLSRRSQRLGDLVAGTLVVWEAEEAAPDLALLPENKFNSLRGHAPLVARLRQAVTPAEARVAWMALRRRERLTSSARMALFAELAEHFQGRTKIPAELSEGLSDEQMVRNIIDVVFVRRP